MLTTSEVRNILTLEFGEGVAKIPSELTFGRITSDILDDTKSLEVNLHAMKVEPAFKGKPPFGKFIRAAAENIKNECISKIQRSSAKKVPKFYVVQLRGTDRPPIKKSGIDYVISKMTSLGITQDDYVYLMTDLPSNDDYVTGCKAHFGSTMCQAGILKYMRYK